MTAQAKTCRVRLLSTFAIACFVYLNLFSSLNPGRTSLITDLSIPDSFIVMLDWTGFFGRPLASSGRNYLAACPELEDKCRLTSDRKLAQRAAALIFHAEDTWMLDVPFRRQSRQRYVYFTHESAVRTWPVNYWLQPCFFNWTMTMSLKSDIPWPYARFQQIHPQDNNYYESNISGTHISLSTSRQLGSKPGWVAWLVSHCTTDSNRETYVKELSKHIPVDVYGGCGVLNCPSHGDCREIIANKYRFYIAFENSVCDDYVTEKFWWMLTKDVVVVTLSASELKNHDAPKQSFIAADDFASPKQLAEYLLKIGNDQALYDEYFAWKRNYKVILDDSLALDGICGLCRLLLGNLSPSAYRNVDDWYRNVSRCESNFASRLT